MELVGRIRGFDRPPLHYGCFLHHPDLALSIKTAFREKIELAMLPLLDRGECRTGVQQFFRPTL